ncbi:MAG: exodeoxyribonuclease VII large subunit [Chloroflexi bacterium]|jgi:exodeoxyribonuclease VII large subunit|nr:exodeoxyribonuclease VII large subunit [Chloroflexota bacterium]
MEQLALFDASPRWTVTDLTRHLRQLLEADPDLQGVWVQGEISNLSRPSSGHIYFTLKDSGASLRCVMWKGEAARLRFAPQDGMAIEAHGSLGIYEVSGQYQLYADSLRPLGEGTLYQEFLRLKALLEAEGLFDAARKRPIPASPRRIGIVTSPTGAALRDMLNTLRRRMPLAEVVLAPAPVQGDEASLALVAALRTLNRVAAPEVILLARGGGSIEDLWAFNDERVVRAVTESQAPVITGVGHETDFTLADFAADLRAPTPTAAAELATAITVLDLRQTLIEMAQILEGSMGVLFERQHNLLEGFQSGLRFYSPLRRVQTDRQRVDELSRRGNAAQAHRLELAAARLKGLENRLTALSPLAVLQRGYAVVTKNKRVVASKSQVQAGDALRVRLRDGEFDARVSGDG